MKTISKVLLPGLLLALCGGLLFSVPALAQYESDEEEYDEYEDYEDVVEEPAQPTIDSGFYLEAAGGGSRSLDQDAKYNTALGSRSGDIDFKAGWVAGGALGFRVNQARFELAGQYRLAAVEKITLNPLSGASSGDIIVTTGMANFYYDFDFGWPVSPFLGGGLGIAHIDLDAEVRPLVFVVDETTNEIAWNIMAGMSMAVAPSTELFLSFRHIELFDEATVDASFPGTSLGDLDFDYSVNDFTLGLRYTF